MFGLKTFFFGLVSGCVGMYLALQFHVANTNNGLIVLSRSHRPPLRSVYVDVRKWSASMWKQHPEVAEAAVLSGRPDLLAEGTVNSLLPEQLQESEQRMQPVSVEKPRIAMDDLVPIRFANPQPETQVPSPGNSFLPIKIPTIDFNWNQSAPEQVQNLPVPEIVQEVLPSDFSWDDLDQSKFPKLKEPVPIENSQRQKSAPNADSSANWIKSLLNNVIPGADSASAGPKNQVEPVQLNPASTNAGAQWTNQSAAPPHPAMGSNSRRPVNPFMQQPQQIYPTVRPF